MTCQRAVTFHLKSCPEELRVLPEALFVRPYGQRQAFDTGRGDGWIRHYTFQGEVASLETKPDGQNIFAAEHQLVSFRPLSCCWRTSVLDALENSSWRSWRAPIRSGAGAWRVGGEFVRPHLVFTSIPSIHSARGRSGVTLRREPAGSPRTRPSCLSWPSTPLRTDISSIPHPIDERYRSDAK